MAGRASGRPTRRKAPIGVQPRVRLTSSAHNRLLGEPGAGEHVDIGIEGGGQDEDRTAQRADVREPVVAPAPAGELAQMRLERAGHLEEVGVGVGQHVGRHRQRQHQRPVQQALPGEAVHGHQPAGAGAERQSPHPDAQAEQRAVAQIFRQDGAGQMRPQALGRLADEAQQGQQWGRHDQAEQGRQPSAAPGRGDAAWPRGRQRRHGRVGDGHSRSVALCSAPRSRSRQSGSLARRPGQTLLADRR